MTNRLYYGDNLAVLRDVAQFPDESVDLIYLDPPFNSNANYNVLFKSKSGEGTDAQITAFEDTWHWNDKAEDAFDQVMRSGLSGASELLRAMRGFLGENDMMAYLAMMAIRLIELHRVLKPTGSLYLHCDPTASHYLKLLLDGVFGPTNFSAEIIWQRTNARSTEGKWPRLHDVILHYGKSGGVRVVQQLVKGNASKVPHTLITGPDGLKYNTYELTGAGLRNGETGQPWRGFDPGAMGRHWGNLHAQMDAWDAHGLIHWPTKGGFPRRRSSEPFVASDRMVAVGDVWTDVDRLNQTAQERLGYPTQKPLALLERIIAASSNEGDVVLDPFCGCGTAVHAAQKLGRQWIGIDVTHLAIHLIEKRLNDAFPGIQYEVHGTPRDLASAQDLAARDKHQFELWALAQVDAVPWKGGRKGADTGIDGIIYFKPDGKRTEKAIVEVKGGGTGVKDIGRLAQVMQREGAELGVFITAEAPTRAMESNAAAVGRFTDEWGRTYPKLQILTLAELFQGKKPDIPFVDPSSIKRAKREDGSAGKQGTLI